MRYRSAIAALVLATLGLLANAAPSFAETCDSSFAGAEGIPYFASDIVVQPDATTTVRETIRVVAKGQLIRHDIERDFPGRYEDAQGHLYNVDVRILDVRRDGTPVPYTTIATPGGTRVAIGAPNALLSPGEYTYTFAYRVIGNLGFFPDRDALYWPVTGSTWTIPISCATATVQLPPDVPRIGIHPRGWVGSEAQPTRQFEGSIDRAGIVSYVADGPLGIGQGLILSVDWPRGFVREPITLGQSLPLVGAGKSGDVLLLGLSLVAVYGAFAWRWVRRGPRRPPTIVATEPPNGLSPAVVRYLATGRHDERTLVAAVLDLAAKGFLTIRERDAKVDSAEAPGERSSVPARTFALARVDHPSPRSRITPEEGAVLAELFGLRSSVCPVGRESSHEMQRALSELKRLIDAIYEGTFFTTHARYLIPALFISLVAVVGATLAEANRASLGAEAAIIWLAVASCLVYGTAFILGAVLLAVRYTTARQWLHVGSLCLAAYLLPLLVAFVALTLTARTPPLVVALLGALGVALAMIRRLLLTPTREGHMMRFRLDSFKTFLARSASELGVATDIGEWSGTWDMYLPYAVALEVDDGWFAPLVRAATTPRAKGAESGGAVDWYQAGSRSGSAGDVAASLAEALCNAVKESLRAPRERPAETVDRGGRLLGKG